MSAITVNNAAFQRATHELSERFRLQGRGDVAGRLLTSLEDGAHEFRSLAYSEIHRGPWDQVWIEWRDLYTIASIRMLGDPALREQDALRTIDMALLFGACLFRDELKSSAARISHVLSSRVSKQPLYVNTKTQRTPRAIPARTRSPVPRVFQCDLFRFQRDFVHGCRPVVIEGGMAGWPCVNQRPFSDMNYLKRAMGFRTVPVESGRSYTHDPVWRPTLMTIAEFIDNHVLVDSTGPVHYLAQHDLFEQVPELRHDAPIPDYCIVAFDAEEPVVRSSVWFGPAGTQTPLHTDPEDNLLCQVFGSKYVRLYFAADTPRVHPRQDMPNTSEVDLANPDRDRFPLFDTVPCFETTLNQGDMLFIPKGMWHYVESLSASFSVNFWWSV
ncbi:JmjC domain-containing protein [Plasmodiophora brassicae]|uniref:JmjC domain-containing protein n=1 Tax=Plasmodiophora brassicae TaxID=37360 RepID=A0A0G4J1B8_PLABS|nr:hypothetical protein PBRA_008411 [Plasmodiophora brassicae]SPQ97023.1 unnamed protein product [Plasmodiophora brassicae]